MPALVFTIPGGKGEIPWCFSQVKGTIEDEVADGECGQIMPCSSGCYCC